MLGEHREPAEKIHRGTMAQMKVSLRDRLPALSTHCSHSLRRSGRKTERPVFLSKADPWLEDLWMDLKL